MPGQKLRHKTEIFRLILLIDGGLGLNFFVGGNRIEQFDRLVVVSFREVQLAQGHAHTRLHRGVGVVQLAQVRDGGIGDGSTLTARQ